MKRKATSQGGRSAKRARKTVRIPRRIGIIPEVKQIFHFNKSGALGSSSTVNGPADTYNIAYISPGANDEERNGNKIHLKDFSFTYLCEATGGIPQNPTFCRLLVFSSREKYNLTDVPLTSIFRNTTNVFETPVDLDKVKLYHDECWMLDHAGSEALAYQAGKVVRRTVRINRDMIYEAGDNYSNFNNYYFTIITKKVGDAFYSAQELKYEWSGKLTFYEK